MRSIAILQPIEVSDKVNKKVCYQCSFQTTACDYPFVMHDTHFEERFIGNNLACRCAVP